MKRISIIGCCGSGKSTLAKALHHITKIPLIHLDQHFWNPNWVETEKEEWTNIVKSLSNKPNWIIDGNYGGTMDIRLQKSDTIIYLDRSTWLCVYRILKRTLLTYGKTRPDMPEGCKERFDFEFLKYVINFNRTRRPGILEKLASLNEDQQVIVLDSNQAVEKFLLLEIGKRYT